MLLLRDNPPDILLTNYKMLDFLLIRPRDQPLWRFNGPDTLRYLVVDELHTFDGAQGTDLAMLIRRLRHRLRCEGPRLICIGTSATLGDASETGPLRDYAGQVFATVFDEESVIICHTTGWLTLKSPQDSRVVNSPDKIYASFFARYPDTFIHRIYPRLAADGASPRAMTPLLSRTLCGQCGHLGSDLGTQCPHCQSDDVLPVHLAGATRQVRLRVDSASGRAAKQVTVHDDRCPVCGERHGQLIIGAQTTSLAAHAVERLWSARLNDHKKLILFSDSVQDAAHRAGYIESKTEGMLMRAGLAKALATLPAALPWDQTLEAIGRCYLDPASPLALSPRDFVARFIPPGMEWLRDWRDLVARGTVAPNARLPEGDFDRFQFTKPRSHWIPHRGRFDAPRFITRDAGRHGFLHLEERDGNPLLR